MNNLQELRLDCEVEMAYRCYFKEKKAKQEDLEYRCTCACTIDWTEEECLEYLNG